MEISTTKNFRNAFKKLPTHVKAQARIEIELFRSDPTHETLFLHPLKGKYKNHWAFSIDWTYRIIFRYKNKDAVIFENIGTHSIYQ